MSRPAVRSLAAVVGGVLGILLLASAGCGSDSPTQPSSTSPSTPPSPPTSQPTLFIADLRIEKAGTGTGTVTTSPPGISCGQTCSVVLLLVTEMTLTAVPDEGSTFEGFTGDPDCLDGQLTVTADVTCTAVFDFVPPPVIAVTDFLAFGDSLTFGVVSEPAGTTFNLVGTPESYPTALDELLADRFTTQRFMMDNQGAPGFRVEESLALLPAALASNPQVMLLIHGANNLDPIGGMSPSAIAAGVAEAATGIDMMVQQGQASGAAVFVATLPPQRADVSQARAETAPIVPILNQQIVAIAAARQATLVDLFNGVDLSLIGPDGLHPTTAGYRRFAELFFSAIVAAFELPEGETPGETPTDDTLRAAPFRLDFARAFR